MSYTPRLQDKYRNEVVPAIKREIQLQKCNGSS